MEQIRGVNLGGWLVLERWMTPSLFKDSLASDEYSLSYGASNIVVERIRRHRESFITEDTILEIKRLGLNTVRLPVGYWLFGDVDPYVNGADTYVGRLFDWCEKHSIGVILDVHAAPGSQNGWDHSGRSGQIGWGHGNTVQETLRFVDALLGKFGDKTALRGLEVLNEPHWEVSMKTLIDYYERVYDMVRNRYPDLMVIMSDAFRPDTMVKQLQKRKFTRVVVDVHLYQLYTDLDRALDLDGHLHKTEHEWSKLLKKLTKRMPLMVGEWSAAMHEMYQPIHQPTYTKAYSHSDYVRYFQAQRNVFENANVGWMYWTAKVERGGPWSLLDNPEYFRNS